MTKITKICNMCGKDIDKLDLQCNPFSLEHQFGYGSVHDMEILQVDFCSKCQDKFTTYLIENCKISPIKEDECCGY